MYMLSGGAPFRRDSTGAVYDSAGERVKLLGDTMRIFSRITTDPEWADTEIAYVSRTGRGMMPTSKQCLAQFNLYHDTKPGPAPL